MADSFRVIRTQRVHINVPFVSTHSLRKALEHHLVGHYSKPKSCIRSMTSYLAGHCRLPYGLPDPTALFHDPVNGRSNAVAHAKPTHVPSVLTGAFGLSLQNLFTNFAVSFSIISILTGLTTQFGTGLNNGGPVVMVWGWVLVCFFSFIVGLSMAEICSSFPVRGQKRRLEDRGLVT